MQEFDSVVKRITASYFFFLSLIQISYQLGAAMSPKKSISITLSASLISISTLLISNSPAFSFGYQVSGQTQASRQTKVNQLFSQNSKQPRTNRSGTVLTPSWQPGTIDLYTIGSVEGGHSLPVRSVAFNPDGKFLASGSADKTIKIWNLKAQTLERTLPKNSDQVYSIAFSSDGKFLASGSLDATVNLWDWKKGKLIKTLNPGKLIRKQSDRVVTFVTFSPNSQTLASSSGDNSIIKLWNVSTGDLRREIVEEQSVTSVAFSPDSQILASGGLGRTVKLWNPETGKQIRTLGKHTHPVYSIAFSPDGKTLASGSGDNTIKLWPLRTRDKLRTLEGHSDDVTSIAFSPNGQTLISGSWDKTVKLWNLQTGQRIRDFSENSLRILSVAFSSDGKTFASVSGDKTIKIWRSQE